jgi:hypothetical protein
MEVHQEGSPQCGQTTKIDMGPWQGKAILNRRETLRQVYDDRVSLQGGNSTISDDPARLAALTRYLSMMPQYTAAPARRYITRQHLEKVAPGEGPGEGPYRP